MLFQRYDGVSEGDASGAGLGAGLGVGADAGAGVGWVLSLAQRAVDASVRFGVERRMSL